MPVVEGHPNRAAFRGVLTLVDVPSDRAPSGARGHRVVLTRSGGGGGVAFAAGDGAGLFSVARPARCAAKGWRDHARGHCGAESGVGRISVCEGFSGDCGGRLRGRRGRDGVEARTRPSASLGMSYEIADAQRGGSCGRTVWTLTQVTFTGAAILRRDKAAYRETWIELE